MARVRSISSIETEIEKVEADLTKAQQKCDALSAKLLKLQKQKHEYEAKQILDAFHKSGKSLQELMIFLDV
ncbi:MAG: DUF4315 family protein [Lachnospiraceae bacterium]|nr:DUF4315 family protein [Lachnospiraceae bacterium]